MSGPLVMVAVRDPAHAEDLVKLACRLARADGAEVVAVSVAEVGPALPLDAEAEVLDESARQALEKAAQVAGECGLSIARRLVRARAGGPALVEEARERAAGVLILGYHGRLGIGEILLGSCVQYVAAHAPCRVVLQIRPAAPHE
jgi:nucleotide-binding universal stress UspA family protein